MRSEAISLSGFILSGCLALAAQTPALENYPPPTAPFVAAVPERAQWTITVDYSQGASAKTEATSTNPGSGTPTVVLHPDTNPVTEIRSIKTGTLKQDTIVYKNGNALKYWYMGSIFLSEDAGGRVSAYNLTLLAPTAFGSAERAMILERGNLIQSEGFPGLDWVKLKYYDKVVLLDKIPSYHYVLPAGGVPFAEAWISAESKLPVKYAGSGALYTFAFGSTPTTDLALPPAYSQTATATQKYLDHLRELQNGDK